MIIVIAGMIGAGKSTYTTEISKYLNSEAFFESVEDNPILPLFYTLSEEELDKQRVPFLLQLYFLNTRFKSIKEALVNRNNVLDRSIYEDKYFKDKNVELGRISKLESDLYDELLDNMLEEIEGMEKKAPDLLIYLSGSFETIIKRIIGRGRGYEVNKELEDYYYHLWKDYDNWIYTNYDASEILEINIDEFDIVNNEDDKLKVFEMLENKLKEVK